MFVKPLFILLLTTLFTVATASVNRRDPPKLRTFSALRNFKRAVVTEEGGPLLEYVELPIDHRNSSSPKFRNRYWVDDTYYKAGGPVIVSDIGEQAADDHVPGILNSATGSIAKEFNGLMIIWEHRFYGQSMPDMTNDMQFLPDQLAEYFRYHTIEQALEDVVVFAKNFTFDGLSGQDLRPGNTPWVFMGGSYPGARAAWIRSRNPEIFHASLASSAVVQLQVNMPQYYHIIEETMDTTGYANCSADMRAMSQYIDAAIEREDYSALSSIVSNVTTAGGPAVLNLYTAGDSNDPEYVNWETVNNVKEMLEIYVDFQNVGMGGRFGVFCDGLQAAVLSVAGENATTGGVFANYADDVETAAQIYSYVLGAWWARRLEEPDMQGSAETISGDTPRCADEDKNYCMAQIEGMSWTWQTCSEFGAFFTMEKGRKENLLPYHLETEEMNIENCMLQFGNAVSAGPDITPVNTKYGGWNINPSNVLWTDGVLDPWRAITPNSVSDESPKRPKTTVIPNSGETPGGDTFLGVLIEGGFHVADLSFPESTGLEAHELFKSALRKWLPAFQKHDVSAASTIGESEDDEGAASSMEMQTRGLVVAVVAAVVVLVAL